MLTSYESLGVRGLSGTLWRGFNPPAGNQFELYGSGNPAIGFFDDFLKMGNTTLYDGYLRVQTSSGTVAQIASDYDPAAIATTGMGMCRLHAAAGDNSEGILAWGNALDLPFKLTGRDLCFECRARWSDITTSSHGEFIGLASSGALATVKVIAADDTIYASADFLGFQRLKGETSAIDGMYQVSGDTKVDGAVNTNLDSIATITADTFLKLGFRYNSNYGTIHWFVDGVEVKTARLSIATIEAASADSFPDGNFMTPVAAIQDDGTTACNLDLDWWACAQAL